MSYFFWYGLGRFWIEGLRTDSLYFFGLELFGAPVRVSQVLALATAAAAGGVLAWQLRKKHDPEQLFVNRLAARRQEENQGGEPPAEEGPECRQ